MNDTSTSQPSPAAPAAAERIGGRSSRSKAIAFLGTYGTLVVLAAVIIFFSSVLGSTFFDINNFRNILVQSTIGIVIGLGLTVVLMVGEFDLSVGYVASLAGVATAALYTGSLPNKALAVLIVLGIGAAAGLLNGLIVTKLGVNALVATLGVGSLVQGVNYIVTEGTPQNLSASGRDLLALYLQKLGGVVPWALVLLVVVIAIVWLLLNRTTFGLEVQAVGGNRVAAELSGIRVHRVIIFAFVIGGLLAALGGLLITANVGSGQSNGGEGFLLSSFAAAFLGSAALRNGEFHILGTVIGVLTVATGVNGMAIMGVPTAASYIFQGALLILAVGMSTSARRLISGRRIGH